MLFTKEMEASINKQINEELFSAYLYQSMAAYFEANNLSGFANTEVDKILNALEIEKSHEKKVILYKETQKLIHENEPVTFLYWLDIKTAFNSRIENITINPLGAIQQCWNWRIKK